MTVRNRSIAKGLKLERIPDPGNGKAIQCNLTGYMTFSTGGMETRTLAAPQWAGQLLMMSMILDGGDNVIATTPAINTTGNNRITFSAVGQYILLIGVPHTTGFVWRVLGRDGAALSTV